MRTWSKRYHREDGATIVLFAIAAVAIFGMVAIVIDIAAVRADREGNKKVADFAAAAGMRALEGPNARPHAWRGVCEAVNYVRQNSGELASMAGTFTNVGTGSTVSDPCANDEVTDPYLALACVPGNQATWARYNGTSADGRLTVEIQSGYLLPDPAFATDTSSSYAGDDGDPDEQGCDNLVVIISEREDHRFAGVFGYDSATSIIRSVGRVILGEDPNDAVALLLLERRDCRAVWTNGSNASILVEANLTDYDGTDPLTAKPGFIHADSDGRGHCPGGSRVLEGIDLVPSNGLPNPSIRAANAVDGSGNLIRQARISTPSKVSSPATSHTPYPDTIGDTEPINGRVVGRRPVDERYLSNIAALDGEVTTTLAGAPDASWEIVTGGNCNPSTVVPYPTPAIPPAAPKTKLWFDCNLDIAGSGAILIDDTVTDVVVDGSLKVAGTLSIADPERVYVWGKTTGNNRGVELAGGTISVNSGDATAALPCQVASALATSDAVFAVKNGSFFGNGGNMVLCRTFLYMMNGGDAYPQDGAGDPLAGTAPGTFGSYRGIVDVGGNGKVSWTAPNSVVGRHPTPSDLATHRFEDLALWTEASNTSSVAGGGGISMSGIFFLPNANPFRLVGAGGQTIDADAQFIARKLELNGNAVLSMQPDPYNSVPIPIFEDFVMVR